MGNGVAYKDVNALRLLVGTLTALVGISFLVPGAYPLYTIVVQFGGTDFWALCSLFAGMLTIYAPFRTVGYIGCGALWTLVLIAYIYIRSYTPVTATGLVLVPVCFWLAWADHNGQ